jgi:hypothetical protein
MRILVLQLVPPTCLPGIRKSVCGDDDAAVVPAMEVRVIAGPESEMGLGTHGCWRLDLAM